MSDTYYKVTGSANPSTDWTTEIILEKDDDGVPTKVVTVGQPIALSADDKKTLEGLGYKVESSSKSEAEEVAQEVAQQPGGDVAGAAPQFGTASGEPNQATADNEPDDDKSSRRGR